MSTESEADVDGSGQSRWRASVWPRLRALMAYAAGPALGLITGPILAHALGATGRGQFAAIMEPITLAGAVASLGVPAAVAYFAARNPDRSITAYRAGLRATLAPAVIVFIAMCLYAPFVARTQDIAVLLLIGCWSSVLISALVQVRRGYWQGNAAWRRLEAERLTFAALRFAVIVVLFLFGVVAAGAYAVGALLAFVAAAVLLWLPRDRAHSGDLRTRGAPRIVGFRSYSLAASVGTISAVAGSRLDQVLMPGQTSSAELGIYAVAVTIAEVPLIAATISSRNVLQATAAGASIRDIVRDVLPYAVVGVLSALVLGGLSPFYLPWLFGPEFAASAVPAMILAVGSVLAIPGQSLMAFLQGRGRPAIASAGPIVVAGLTLCGFVVLWGHVDAVWAAIIASAAQAVGLLVTLILAWRERRRGRAQ